jgi:heme exporter protein A
LELRVSDLVCHRGGVPVLAGVKFVLNAGQALVLRGPNGVGKTTLLRTLAGLQRAEGGVIEMPDEAVAYAGHADGLKLALSVRDNLTFWAAAYGTNVIAPALVAFDLESFLDRQAQDLSAGQKRRLGLARMLVTGRPIWIFDEPTVSLDDVNTRLFVAMVHRHLATGGMALLATHIDLGLAEAETLDLSPFRARADYEAEKNDVFLAEGF